MAQYSFDSSAFIDPLKRHHPRDIFGSLWKRIDDLIDSGEIMASEFVKEEISKKDDDIYKYVKSKNNLFFSLDEYQQAYVDKIVNRFPRWVPVDSTRNMADPFVIALAGVFKLTVVTYEGKGSANDPKIPFVCKEFAIPCLSFIDFLRAIKFNT